MHYCPWLLSQHIFLAGIFCTEMAYTQKQEHPSIDIDAGIFLQHSFYRVQLFGDA